MSICVSAWGFDQNCCGKCDLGTKPFTAARYFCLSLLMSWPPSVLLNEPFSLKTFSLRTGQLCLYWWSHSVYSTWAEMMCFIPKHPASTVFSEDAYKSWEGSFSIAIHLNSSWCFWNSIILMAAETAWMRPCDFK